MDWHSLDALKYRDEGEALIEVKAALQRYRKLADSVQTNAVELVGQARNRAHSANIVGSLLARIDLASAEGLALMRISEAVLRAKDVSDQDQLILEQLSAGDWDAFGRQGDVIEKAMATAARVARSLSSGGWLGGLGGHAAVRVAVLTAVKMMANQFVLGETIGGAIQRAKSEALLCSFDMLGEGARTVADADRYESNYSSAIGALAAAGPLVRPEDGHGISIKLSALDPRYEAVQSARALRELYPRLERLMLKAAGANLGFFIDAEEMDRLVISLELLDRLEAAAPKDWTGLGLAVQGYQRRSTAVVAMLIDFARARKRRLMMRLVKGAYWDGEIKRAQVAGHPDYPLFTTKAATDCAYLACAEMMIGAGPAIYPAFATHNAHTIAAIRGLAEDTHAPYEFQRLHGMGEALYSAAELLWQTTDSGTVVRVSDGTKNRVGVRQQGNNVRVYAPVGGISDLLGYLVRRLLENGANSSFVRGLHDKDVKADTLVADPLSLVEQQGMKSNPRVLLPSAIFGVERLNSSGLDLSIKSERDRIARAVEAIDGQHIKATPMVGGKPVGAGAVTEVYSPADRSHLVGQVASATLETVKEAYVAALNAQPSWNAEGGARRGLVLRRMADCLEREKLRFVALLAREGGRTLNDGVAEVREAVDFCRYYAALAERQFVDAASLGGPTGELNKLRLLGRGAFVCVSPWNFPLAIFTGQIAAALAAGNAVLAKPAPQTSLVAFEAAKLFLEAGLDPDLLAVLPGSDGLGEQLVCDARHSGVAFTGSLETAKKIQLSLAARSGPIAPFVAETSGLNGIFADTTALPEQIIDDVVVSAFGSAGQRCSSARLLFLPESLYPDLVKGLKEAIKELIVGDPTLPQTDMGPIIDKPAHAALVRHVASLQASGVSVHQLDSGRLPARGTFFGPVVAELPSIDGYDRETFGPIIHVVRYKPGGAVALARKLAAKGYGLTLGIHTRLKQFADEIISACPVGNVYINRSIIGAVVGVQPFGGFGLSGTGNKAGGPNTLLSFANQQSISDNTAAKGGDLSVINLAAGPAV